MSCDGATDVAIVWGPVAGYFAGRQRVPMTLVPIPSGKGDLPFAFDIAMGVKPGNEALRARAEQVNVFARVTPAQKARVVAALRARDHVVGYLGDGVNDAAALAAADLSMAMGTGTDTAIATADITLMNPALASIKAGLDLSRKTLSTIRGNLVWAFIYNVIGIPIAALGLLQPMYAAAAMALSSLFVVTNSLRIK
mgnify:CR=1 FL=1